MILQIADILSGAEVAAMCDLMHREDLFEDGKKSAGWHARTRKDNLQASDSPLLKGASRKVKAALEQNGVFQAAARPKSIAKLIFSRYEPGMAYGTHVDDATMAGQRTDLSFTLFLADPETYEGGELVLEQTDGERAYKLRAGHVLLYPSTTLHRVEPVTEGIRLAAVGWVRSLIRNGSQRELLFDLDQAVRLLREDGGRERALDLVLKTRSNLLRRWVED